MAKDPRPQWTNMTDKTISGHNFIVLMDMAHLSLVVGRWVVMRRVAKATAGQSATEDDS